MEKYFPADVSLRVTGEFSDAQKLFPVAKQLLARAVRLKEGGLPLVRLFIPGSDGSLVHVRMHMDMKHVYVQPGKRVTKEEKKIPVVPEEVGVVYLMLSGLVRPGTLVNDAAHEFHPTLICANSYGLEYAYQDMPKLGIASVSVSGHVQARSPKPSMYSGAMKRVVQALYGLGKVGAESLDEDLAGAGTTEIRNQYRYDWAVTHGIVKDSQGVWLIEVSYARGVLKMLLPVIPGTEEDAYLSFIEGFDDTETAGIITEFGGLPSGETFPVNDSTADPPNALDLAIAEGTVKRLMTADDIKPFYQDVGTGILKGGLFAGCGWAFSETGNTLEAHNTCFWYKNENFATILDTARATYELLEAHADYPTAVVAPIEDRALTAEHWKFSFGTSAATLSLVEKSYFAGPQKTVFLLGMDTVYTPVYDFKDTEMLRVQSSANSDSLVQAGAWGRPPSGYKLDHIGRGQIATYLNYSCPVLVFFKGETLEVVRHQPERTYSESYVAYAHPQNFYESPNLTAFYNTPDVIHAFSAAGQTCTSTETDNFTRYKSIPGYDIWSGTYAHRTSTTTCGDFVIDLMYGATFICCSGGPAGDHTDEVEHVVEFSATSDESEEREGEQQDISPLYGYAQPQWGGYPFRLHFRHTYVSHTKVVEIGHGDNTSVGHIEEQTSTATHTYSLITGVQYAADIEGFVYNTNASVSGGSTDIGYHVTSISERSPHVWRRSGAFYSTSLDLRRNEQWSYLNIWVDPVGYFALTAANWESKIGLIVPAFVREGYAFVKWDGGYQALFSGGSVTGSTQLPEQRKTYLVVPGLTTGVLVGNTHTITQPNWDKLVNAITFRYGASVDAGPTKCGILQTDIYGDIIIPGVLSGVLTPPQTFTGSAGGIPVTDCTSPNSTFVGAV